MLNNICPWCQY